MNESPPERSTLVPVAELLGAALALYWRNASLLIGVAMAAALVGNLVGLLMSPSDSVTFVIWSQLIAALVTALQAPVWLLAVLARRGEPLTAGAVLYGLGAFAARFFAVGMLLGVAGGGLLLLAAYFPVISLPAVPILVYLAVRLSLAGPAIVLERRTPVQALMRSWQIVEDNWFRTFIVQLPVLVFAIILVAVGGEAASRVDSTLVAVVASAVALGASAPLVALVETALFEEYSGWQPPEIEAEQAE